MSVEKTILLSTSYLGQISYFAILVQQNSVLIEKFENYQKQSFRNRCEIYSANGELSLTIPVQKPHFQRVLTSEIKIDYATLWQKIHWKAIESAYRNAPFFEFYVDDLLPFFRKKYTFLLDLNFDLQNLILEKWLEVDARNISFTSFFESKKTEDIDFRDIFHPKKPLSLTFEPYKQVFGEKFGFISNLSILDLIFHLGPESLEYLSQKKICQII